MEALLSWCLRMVDTIGPDIVAARDELDRYEAGTHPDQDAYHGLSSRQRVTRFAALTAEHRNALPGQLSSDGQSAINWAQIAIRLNLTNHQVHPHLRDPVLDRDLPVAAGSFVGTITGRIDDQPWRQQPITTQELSALMKCLSAACFVVISYLSGMRPGETLNLRRGCASQHPDTGQLLVNGRYGKGHGRAPRPEDGEHDPWARAWVVVRPVHQAIEILEQLSESPFLFPASLTGAHVRRPADHNARRTGDMTHDLQRLIDWVNTTFARTDGKPLIPTDPNGRIYPSRFRRTLAYFIVRRPRGLIAAALQYGHVSTTVTLSYSGKADTGWQDDVAVERLEAILEQNEQDHLLLAEGESVSGPAATAYQDQIQQTHRFAGRSVNRVRNVERLLAQVDPNIHHGDAMTCVYRPETAACRTARVNEGLPVDDGPLEAECQSGCLNLAYTDRDIQLLRERVSTLDAGAEDPLAPEPLRDRTRAQASQARSVIARHETTTTTDATS
ncbi:integrase [Flexivirga sp. ID2601S]|uniref:Integrase n=2 Tax=Flexivirga TaxID=1096776 RepID=A0A849AP86_9MICO|nr:integrase [Flexivirga aerilata]NNG41316.1 integrase [Flexivirga aerilata]